MKPKFTKLKRPKSICVAAFPKQFKKLNPERSAATAGLRGRSASEALRMEIYRPIASMFKELNPLCHACKIIKLDAMAGSTGFVPLFTQDVHHNRGRSGLLLFDTRHWLAVCRQCHDWIGAHPDEAMKLGLLDKRV